MDIDSTPEALKTFRERLIPMVHRIRPGSEGHGHLVVVSGSSGTGKTSLLHRCVHELVQLLDGEPAGIGDDGDASGSGQPPLWKRRPPARSAFIVTLDGSGNDGHGIGSRPGRTPSCRSSTWWSSASSGSSPPNSATSPASSRGSTSRS
ncbi:hypothetical protein GCM10020256_04720 [Streptomyces thermocoprophilus]